MSLKSFFAKIFAQQIYRKTQLWATNPIATQQRVFEDLIHLAKNTQWLNKNAIVTNANSNLEVWIRDVSLTGNKLSGFLKNIKQSMAELGASLSKVSINGKVAFVREN